MARSRIQPASTSHGEVASTTSTDEDNFRADQHQPEPETSRVGQTFEVAEIGRLQAFLDEHFSDQANLSNRQQPETTVDIAIRLLTGMHAQRPPQQVSRCETQYCNKPSGHTDGHGWVHFG